MGLEYSNTSTQPDMFIQNKFTQGTNKIILLELTYCKVPEVFELATAKCTTSFVQLRFTSNI
jgi:hypothetical protein